MKQLPFLLKLVRGAIGKKYVIKHYPHGVVLTRYPDMTRIKPSREQQACRNLFKEAVAFAKAALADRHRKLMYEQLLGKRKRLFQAIMQHYMTQAKRAMQPSAQSTRRLTKSKTTGPASHTYFSPCRRKKKKALSHATLRLPKIRYGKPETKNCCLSWPPAVPRAAPVQPVPFCCRAKTISAITIARRLSFAA